MAYEQYMGNVVTVLSRSTHLLAVPPCKLLDPRVRVGSLLARVGNMIQTDRWGPCTDR